MSSVLLDTHTIVWYLHDPKLLSANALHSIRESIANGDNLYVSVITLIELVYLVEKGRIPRQALKDLVNVIKEIPSTIQVLPVDLSLADTIERIPRDIVPDMPDRIIAATSVLYDLPLISRDSHIHKCGIKAIW